MLIEALGLRDHTERSSTLLRSRFHSYCSNTDPITASVRNPSPRPLNNHSPFHLHLTKVSCTTAGQKKVARIFFYTLVNEILVVLELVNSGPSVTSACQGSILLSPAHPWAHLLSPPGSAHLIVDTFIYHPLAQKPS